MMPEIRMSVRLRRGLLRTCTTLMSAMVLLLLSCGDGVGPIAQPDDLVVPADTFSLNVAATPGVIGTPATGTFRYQEATSVTYAFSAASGFENVQVKLDGLLVPSSGSVDMDQSHTLSASADNSVNVSPADTAITRILGEILDPQRTMSAFERFMTLQDSLIDGLGIDSAMHRIRSIRALAYDPVNDAGTLARAMAEISDSLYDRALALNSAPDQSSEPSEAEAPGALPEVVFIYVNGVLTDPTQWESTRANSVVPAVIDASFADPALYKVITHPNRSGKDMEWREKTACVVQASILYSLGRISAIDALEDCFGFGDFVESIDQFAHAVFESLPNEVEPDAKDLATVIESWLNNGSRVVLIPHSQGNLMVKEALDVMRSRVAPADLGCVGTVSIAPPYPIQPTSQGPGVADMIIEGTLSKDVLLLFNSMLLANHNTARVTNTWSDAYDVALSSPWYLILPQPLYAAHEFALAIDLHSIDQSYFGSFRTRGHIVEMIQEQVQYVTENCQPPSSTGTVTVTTATTGASPDADGFTVLVDGGVLTETIEPNETIWFPGISAGSHSVQLTDVAGNCSVTGDNPRSVDVTAGATTPVTFEVSCASVSNSLPFTNDFSSDAGWTNVTSGDFVITGGALSWNTDSDFKQQLYVPISSHSGDFAIEARVRATSYQNNNFLRFGLAESLSGGFGWAADTYGYPYATGAFVEYGAMGGGTGYWPVYYAGGTVVSESEVGRTWNWQDPATYSAFTLNNWYRVLLEVVGQNWRVTLYDDSEIVVGQHSGTFGVDLSQFEYNYVYIGNSRVGDWPEGYGFLDDLSVTDQVQWDGSAANGAIEATFSTTGAALDADGHTVLVDGGVRNETIEP